MQILCKFRNFKKVLESTMSDYVISVFHDLRRAKENDVYPVKLRVYHNYQTRFYPIHKGLTENDFKRSFLAERPRGEMSDVKDKITAEVTRAKEIAKDLRPFTHEKFKKKFLRTSGSGHDVFYHYNEKIRELEGEEKIKTASGYDLSMKSIRLFLKHKGKPQNSISFDAITVKFLNEYEKWMEAQGKGFTTISIYLRNLRTIFNKAKEEQEIDNETYPFGEGKYIIPEGEGTKRALDKTEVLKLYNYDLPKDSNLREARSYWFFSYLANGMNMRDICELRNRHFSGDRFAFIRTKTKTTTKKNIKTIEVILTNPLREIIKDYGTKSKNPNEFVFPIFNNNMTAKEKVRACENHTRFVNQHMKTLAKMVGVDEDISTYYARHSYSTILVNSGESLEFIKESLGHANILTTQRYFAGFNDAKKKENANKLL